jgi:hypothetical protein
LQVLVTAPPVAAGDYRSAAWLGRDTPITVLPSVAALATLRRDSTQPEPPSPYVGFGDPVLAGNTACPAPFPPDDRCPDATQTVVASRNGVLTRAARAADLGSIFRNNAVDVEAVRALYPLPDSAVEIRCVARSLGAAPDDVHLAEGATVTAVRNAALDRYRVIHFATHGLVAGDIESADGSLVEPRPPRDFVRSGSCPPSRSRRWSLPAPPARSRRTWRLPPSPQLRPRRRSAIRTIRLRAASTWCRAARRTSW